MKATDLGKSNVVVNYYLVIKNIILFSFNNNDGKSFCFSFPIAFPKLNVYVSVSM